MLVSLKSKHFYPTHLSRACVGVEKRMRKGLEVFDQLFEKIILPIREGIKSNMIHHDLKGEAIDVLTNYLTVDKTIYKHIKPSYD